MSQTNYRRFGAAGPDVVRAADVFPRIEALENAPVQPPVWVHASDFGVTGDGSVQNEELQAALDAAEGSTLYIPAGDYTLDAQLKVHSNTTVRCDGWRSRFLLSASAPEGDNLIANADPENGDENVFIHGGYWDGNYPNRENAAGGSRPGHSCIVLAHVTNGGIFDTYCVDPALHCIDVSSENQTRDGATVYKTSLSQYITVQGNYCSGFGDDGISTHWADFVLVRGNFVFDPSSVLSTSANSNGIEIDDGSRHVLVDGNVIYETSAAVGTIRRGIEVKGHSTTPAASDVILTNNLIENCGVVAGISCWHQDFDTPSLSPNARELIIEGNMVLGPPGIGISVRMYRHFNVRGNTVRNSGGEPFQFASRARYGVVNGNNARSAGGAAGIVISGSGTRSMIVTSNMFFNTGGALDNGGTNITTAHNDHYT